MINDLVSDQRVDKTCRVLTELGFKVLLVGRVRKNSPPLPDRNYQMHRMRLFFDKGPFFYAEYNIRLLFFLLSRKCQLLVANDLDTLLPNYIIHRLKKAQLVYDSHELFTETPEVIHRKFVRNVWLRIERSIFPRLNDALTVSDSIAGIFTERYGIPVTVVRNIPPSRNFTKRLSRSDLGLPENKKILVMQGSGINIQRGAEELIESMQYLDGHYLLIIGGGDVMEQLKALASSLNLADRIQFIPRLPVDQLYQYTMNADLGISIDKDTNLNYRYSLPNKLFDYIHAGVPVLTSSLVEVKKIVDQYDIGITLDDHAPEHIAGKVKIALSDEKQIDKWKENLKFATSELNWTKEKLKLEAIFVKYA